MDTLAQQFTGLTLKPPATYSVTYQTGSASQLLYDEFGSSQLAPPPPKTNAKILQDLLNELERHENVCYHIKDEIQVAKQEIFCLPSQRLRIEEHNRRMREFVKTEDISINGKGNQNTEKSNIGAGGYAMEEYKAYESRFAGRPDPTLVGALFGILS
ncbi:hypothetical protein OEA41_000152 [Lepraria neglecta]|uniref:Uncharacterized protein n=1 Tax=Lepraria neglecta TaxID=209136 RepID=A0AAD9ZFY4_9LECA|nr:hypothetical protein OEA41_000152 [Lepraria neglecta]